MSKKLTQDEVIQQFIEIHGDKYNYDKVQYVNSTTKVLIGCKVDGHGYFPQTPHKHKLKRGCPKCANHEKLSTEQTIKFFKSVHGDKYLYDKVVHNGNKSNVLIGCKVEGHGYFEQTPDSHRRGSGCPICSNTILHDGNRLSLIKPDLVKYFVNPEEANEYSIFSNKKVQLKCPDCGKLKNKTTMIYQLSKQGFSCDYCSDGISMPEKFGIYLFKQLKVEFETQKIFDWENDKRYDFYIELNDKKYIIEAHGEGHYIYTGFTRPIKEEQENDQLKYDLAISNGINPENYIVIDCRKSEFEWLKNNYITQLEDIFDLSNVDWNEIWKNCQSSFMIKVCKYWKNKQSYETTKNVCEIFKLSKHTVIRYLKRGRSLGLCHYDPKEEMIIATNMKAVYQYDLNGCYINKFNSLTDVEKILKMNRHKISKCCNGKTISEYNFIWSFLPPEEYLKSLEN